MNILLDSHALIWSLHAPERLTRQAADAIRDRRNAVYFSAASVWELEIKAAKGHLTLPSEWIASTEDAGFLQIPVTATVAQLSARLPRHHADPFDRMLVGHAIEHGLRIA